MMDYNGYQNVYQQPIQPNAYYQPTTAAPVYNNQRLWQYYQPSPTQTQVNNPYQQNSTNASGNIIWIQGGYEGAKAYPHVQPGVPVALWDSDEKTIYIKSLDQTGKPQITIIDYTERVTGSDKDSQNVEYATKEQIESISNQFASLNEKLSSLGEYVTKEQFNEMNNHINDLSGQIGDIEDRIMSFGKPQQNNTNTRRGGK